MSGERLRPGPVGWPTTGAGGGVVSSTYEPRATALTLPATSVARTSRTYVPSPLIGVLIGSVHGVKAVSLRPGPENRHSVLLPGSTSAAQDGARSRPGLAGGV